MRTTPWVSLFILSLFFVSTVDVRAQFLGQQSLSESSYVIDQSGTLWVWGRNFYAQLGLGDRIDRDTPCVVPVPEGASKWVLVAGGENFTVAVADSDKLYAWGLNNLGQIGLGQAGGLYAAPMRIPNPPYVTSWKWISAGAGHCEALTSDGRLFAWGDNSLGELGLGNEEYIPYPEQVEFPTGVTAWAAVAAGPGYTMMLSQSGQLYGCGKDSLGTFQPWEGPLLVMPDTFRTLSPLPCIAASYLSESRIDQTSYATDSSDDSDIFDVTIDGGAIESIAGVADGGSHTLFLSMYGSIAAFGSNAYGQLGIANTDTDIRAILVPMPTGVTQFVAVAAGLKHSLAIASDGWLYAWGHDSAGELGIGSRVNESHPTRVLRVCPPVSMTATIGIPGSFADTFSIAVTLHSSSDSLSLTNGNAFLVLGNPLEYVDNAPDQAISSPIAPLSKSSVSWNGTTEQFFSPFSPSYFAYIRAEGSAPLLVHASPPTVQLGPWNVEVKVEDSLTGLPLPGAEVLGLSQIVTTDQDGNFPIPETFGASFTVIRENYSPASAIFQIANGTGYHTLSPLDTLIIPMGPSAIQGTFVSPAPHVLQDSIQKIYFPDSLIGYAISRREIFRTTDSGITWTATYGASNDLHDLKFLDPGHGWVVGDSGTILSTTDSGASWLLAPSVTTHNLRGIAVVDFDTAWAVGDSGTVLKKSGEIWSIYPGLGSKNFATVHFLDAEDGVIAGDGFYYLYNDGDWSNRGLPENVNSAYYIEPGKICFGGKDGTIIYHDDSNYVNTGYYVRVDTLADSAYIVHAINSIYFLNKNIGFAAGDSGSSYVTYNAGINWAPLREFPGNATSINFFSLAGHAASDEGVLNYPGMPCAVRGIVRGRITFGNPPEPIMGAEVDRIYISDSGALWIETNYTNEQGNFVFAGIDNVFPFQYLVTFEDSGIVKTHTFANVTAERHGIVTLNYNDYTAPPPPPPDTMLSVNPVAPAVLSLDLNASPASVHIEYSIPSDGQARLMMQDILGRTVRVIANGFFPAGQQACEVPIGGLPDGAYYVTLESGAGSITKKFVIER